MNSISVQNLKKNYQKVEAVKGISFDVKEGELFAFLGENGAGKSTTINILSTILPKTSGEVTVCGHVLGKEDVDIRSKIGIVFQNSVLDDKLTVKENLLVQGSFYGYSKKEIWERVNATGLAFDLNEIGNRRYEKLSGGQKRRVDIMRALIHKPAILFLDEPTTGLDPMSRKMVWECVRSLQKNEGLTIFLTTHYMEETADAGNVVILNHGEICAQGSPADLKSRYASTKVLWYAPCTPENNEFLNRYQYQYEENHYSVFLSSDIPAFLYENRDKLLDFEVIKGTMDDVFLNLTGKTAEE